MGNIERIQSVLAEEDSKNSLDFSSLPSKVVQKAEALIGYSPNMPDVAEEVLTMMRLGWGWCSTRKKPRLRREIENSFDLFQRNIARCNPDLIPKLHLDVNLDVEPISRAEIEKIRELVSIHFVANKSHASDKFQRDLIAVRHADPVRAQYFRGVAYGGGTPSFFENSFAGTIHSWSKVSIISTANAVEVFKYIAAQDFSVEAQIKKYAQHYLAFYESLHQDAVSEIGADLSNRLYELRSAIIVMKASIGLRGREPLGRKGALELLGEKRYNACRSFAAASLYHILEDRHSKAAHTIIDLQVSTWILGQLSENPFRDPPKEIYEMTDEILGFFADCLSSGRGTIKTVPNLIPLTYTPCLAAARFLYKIAKNFSIHSPALEEARNDIIEYVKTCQHKNGFSGHNSDTEDLVHTSLALLFNSDNNSGWNGSSESKELLTGVKDLISSCFKEEGGYSISPDMPPSAHGTRFALMIQNDFPQTRIPNSKEKVADFIHHLYDENTGGFRGVAL